VGHKSSDTYAIGISTPHRQDSTPPSLPIWLGSLSFVSMVEHGTRMLDRRSHIAAIADALRVSETDLVGGPHLSSARLQSDPHMAILGSLQTNSLTRPAVAVARPVAELHSAVFGTADGQVERAGFTEPFRPLLDLERHGNAAIVTEST
jgi:hypothetical protein